jgi:hypothetical protein
VGITIRIIIRGRIRIGIKMGITIRITTGFTMTICVTIQITALKEQLPPGSMLLENGADRHMDGPIRCSSLTL